VRDRHCARDEKHSDHRERASQSVGEVCGCGGTERGGWEREARRHKHRRELCDRGAQRVARAFTVGAFVLFSAKAPALSTHGSLRSPFAIEALPPVAPRLTRCARCGPRSLRSLRSLRRAPSPRVQPLSIHPQPHTSQPTVFLDSLRSSAIRIPRTVAVPRPTRNSVRHSNHQRHCHHQLHQPQSAVQSLLYQYERT
jgi:hypothetical protein